jgi:hypothetical protein
MRSVVKSIGMDTNMVRRRKIGVEVENAQKNKLALHNALPQSAILRRDAEEGFVRIEHVVCGRDGVSKLHSTLIHLMALRDVAFHPPSRQDTRQLC